MDVAASSLISLRSISDTELESERKPARRSSAVVKRTKRPASPYGTIKSSPKKPMKPTKRTGREIWVEAVQQGGGVSAESKGTSTWRHGKPSHLNSATSASQFLKEQLLTASGSPLPNKHSIRPNSARVGGTGPVYKDAETYYDDIQVLKRQLKQLSNENDQVKAKNVRLEDEVVAKSRKVEELLNPELQSNDLRRTLTSKRPDTSEVVMSLRRKIYKVEENLRDKENIMRKMKSDIKQTNVEELVLENQVCLYEIDRLTRSVNDTRMLATQTMSEGVIGGADNKGKSQILLKRLTDDNYGLVLENKSLKNDLMKLGKGSQNDLNISKDYEDMNRNELLQKISSLEQRLKVEEKKAFKDESTSEMSVDSETIDERCIMLKGPLPQQIKQLRARERELIAEVENLENTVKKLKEDRTHYRKKNDEYRQQVDNMKKKGDEVGPQLLDNMKKKSDDVGSDTASIKSEKSPKHKKSPVKKSTEKISKVKEDKVSEARIQELQETNAARKIQRGWRNRQKVTLRENELKRVKGAEDEELENAIICIQSSWRGHKTRESYLNSSRDREYSSRYRENDDLEDEELILIQSALRGHQSRKQLLQKSKKTRSSLSNKSLIKIVQEEQLRVEDDEDSDDDDVVIGSSASLTSYRTANIPSQKTYQSPINKSSVGGNKTNRGKNKLKLSDFRPGSEELDLGNSLKGLKSSSSPWPDAIHEIEESEDDDNLLITNKKKKTSKNGSKKDTKEQKKSTDDRDVRDITKRWADSGTKDGAKDEDKQTSFQKRLTLRKTQQLLKDFGVDADDNDGDDDLIVAPTFQKKLTALASKKSLLDDELF